MLFVGTPGCGKTLLASRLPGLLPEATEAEAMESASVASTRASLSELVGAGLLARLLDPADDLAFVVRLAEHDFKTELLGVLGHGLLNVGKCLPAIDFGLAAPNQIEVGPVKDVYR